MSRIRLQDIEGYKDFKAEKDITFFKCEDEYPGWTGTEKFIIITDIPEEKLLCKFSQVMKAMRPYMILDSKYGNVRRESISIERSINRFVAIHQTSYDFDEETECRNEELVDFHVEKKMTILLELQEALNTLTEVQRIRIVSHFVEGLSFVEIAKKECVNEKSVRESIYSSIKKIKKFLIDTPDFDL